MGNYHLCLEKVTISDGTYLGGRDTEQRLAIVARLLLGHDPPEQRYVNFVNIHLTTLTGERSGNIRKNRLASRARLRQLDTVLDDIISPYQGASNYRVPRVVSARGDDIWIVGGDFNATEDSEELSLMRRSGFSDCNPAPPLSCAG